MPISDVTASVHNIRLEAPLHDHEFEISTVFVEIKTDDGHTGSELTGYHWPFTTKELVNREMAPRLEGENPVESATRWTELREAFNPRMQTGAWSKAMNAVDIALWDLKGKRLGEPV